MGWSFDRPSFSLSYESQVLPCRAMFPAMGTQFLLWVATAISFYLRDLVSAPVTRRGVSRAFTHASKGVFMLFSLFFSFYRFALFSRMVRLFLVAGLAQVRLGNISRAD